MNIKLVQQEISEIEEKIKEVQEQKFHRNCNYGPTVLAEFNTNERLKMERLRAAFKLTNEAFEVQILW